MEEHIKYYTDLGLFLVALYGIKPDGDCSCYKGSDCPSPGKHPIPNTGLKEASNDLSEIAKQIDKYSNLAIITGKVNDIEVLDVDTKNGGIESLKMLINEFNLNTDTVVLTGSGGLHLYYKYSNSGLTNRANILPGIDFKTDNGYVVCPPSIHHSGNAYKFIPDFSFEKYLEGYYAY